MAAPRIKETEDVLDQEPTPHLSHSRINRYLTCPEQYRLYYVEKLRPRIESAGLVFGVVIHAAIADLFRSGDDPVELFRRDWQNLKDVQLRYKKREVVRRFWGERREAARQISRRGSSQNPAGVRHRAQVRAAGQSGRARRGPRPARPRAPLWEIREPAGAQDGPCHCARRFVCRSIGESARGRRTHPPMNPVAPVT